MEDHSADRIGGRCPWGRRREIRSRILGQTFDADVPMVAGPVPDRIERDLGGDLAVAGLGQDQPDGRAMPAEQDEIDSGRRDDRPGRKRAAPTDENEAVTIGEFGLWSWDSASRALWP